MTEQAEQREREFEEAERIYERQRDRDASEEQV